MGVAPQSVGVGCHREDMETSEVLMLRGTVAWCPDCGDERVLVPADGPDGLCCTSCDAAVFVLDLDTQAHLLERLAG